MGRRRLPALLALLAALVLGIGGFVSGAVASGAHTTAVVGTVTGEPATAAHVGAAGNDAVVPSAPRPTGGVVVRTGHGGQAGSSLREIAILPVLGLLATALAAFLVRQRRRTRPPGWHRSTLLARGPPLRFA